MSGYSFTLGSYIYFSYPNLPRHLRLRSSGRSHGYFVTFASTDVNNHAVNVLRCFTSHAASLRHETLNPNR